MLRISCTILMFLAVFFWGSHLSVWRFYHINEGQFKHPPYLIHDTYFTHTLGTENIHTLEALRGPHHIRSLKLIDSLLIRDTLYYNSRKQEIIITNQIGTGVESLSIDFYQTSLFQTTSHKWRLTFSDEMKIGLLELKVKLKNKTSGQISSINTYALYLRPAKARITSWPPPDLSHYHLLLNKEDSANYEIISETPEAINLLKHISRYEDEFEPMKVPIQHPSSFLIEN